MTREERVEKMAATLLEAEKRGTEIDKLVDQYPELDADLAYQVQDRLIEMKCHAENARIVGFKLGLTSVAKQKMMGVHEPTYGILLDSMQWPEEQPLPLTSLIHPKVEPEIAFVFKHEVRGPGISVPDILEATEYVMPALEIIDSRYRNFSFTLADVIADNSSSARFILGGAFFRPEQLDLRLMGMVFRKNGRIMATSTGAAVMGHPARAIAWLANKLGEAGKSIRAGEIVLSGALCAAAAIEEKDVFSVSFDGLGSLTAVFAHP